MALLAVQNLSKAFDGVPVLEDLSFSVDPGKVLVVCGPSGSGKTTLLRCLNFLEVADHGRILLNDQVLWDHAHPSLTEAELRACRRHFGLVFQQFHLFPQYTVRQNMELAPRLLKVASRSEIQKDCARLMDRLGLTDRADAYPYQLSGGQRQRAAIGRALALKPEVLCLDEPTSALDPALVETVAVLVDELRAAGQTLLVITHDPVFAEHIADQMLVMA